MKKPELTTIGYEGISQAALFQTLVYHDVQTLLDIRELPQSRKPGLSKTALGLGRRRLRPSVRPHPRARHAA